MRIRNKISDFFLEMTYKLHKTKSNVVLFQNTPLIKPSLKSPLHNFPPYEIIAKMVISDKELPFAKCKHNKDTII